MKIIIGPRYPWSNLWDWTLDVSNSFQHLFADLTDVTLADEDNNSITAVDVDSAIIGNMAM